MPRLAPMAVRSIALVALAGLVALAWLLRAERREPFAPVRRAPAVDESESPPRGGAAATPARVPNAPADTSTEADDAAAASVSPEDDKGSIYGSLRDPEGRLVPGLLVRAVRAYDELGATHENISSESWYHIGRLAAGRYWLEASAEGFRTLHRAVELARDEDVELDLVLEPAVRLQVRVTSPDGSPHPEVVADEGPTLVAVVRPGPRTGWDFDVREELDGSPDRFEETHDEREEGVLGWLELEDELPVHVGLCLGEWVLASEHVFPGSASVQFRLAHGALAANLATVRVRVSGAPVDPLRSVRVWLAGVAWKVPDARGVAEFPALLPGRYGAIVEKGERAVLAEPGVVTEVEIPFACSAAITGTVVDERGGSRNYDEYLLVAVPDMVTGELGCFRRTRWHSPFEIAVEPGAYVLRLEDGETRSSRSLLVHAREGVAEQVVLTAVRPVPIVLEPDAARRGLRYRVLDENGIVAAKGRFRGPRPHRLELPPGRYRMLVTDDERTLVDTSFVALDSPTRVPVRM